MKKSSITISKNLRVRIKRAKDMSGSGTYEFFLTQLLDRDKLYREQARN